MIFKSGEHRIEKDSMGEIKVPKEAYYAAQTQRAIDNFPISGIPFSHAFISALALVKKCAAHVNADLKLLPKEKAQVIELAASEIIEGKFQGHFPIDIFQTGSGTSTNMNVNEVITKRANEFAAEKKYDFKIHPNDDVNYGQSSNDSIPTAIRVSAYIHIEQKLIPNLKHLHKALKAKGDEYAHVVKTGRTHLMDAMPVTFKQVFGGYARQVELGIERVESTLKHLKELPQGGTAVGTGINTHKEFGKRFAESVAKATGLPFIEAKDHFEAQSTVDAPAEVSGQLKTLATSLMKIANDLRWSNSGPYCGLADVQLAALQPGSSIMPGKVNPVIEESTIMACAQVIANDTAVTIGASWGNFELNVMLPLVAHNLLSSIEILANVAKNFADMSVSQIVINEKDLAARIGKNPILVTALNPLIGYDLAAKIAKKSYAENRSLKDVAKEMCDLSEKELDEALDPRKMT